MKKIKKSNIFLAIILLLSAILEFVNISIEGTGNAYYAAAVKSMTMSWKNFFFVAFDPSGFVSIDKPPVGFWFQALSAKIFGFNSFAIMLPQILATIISVFLIYIIVKKSFGETAGLLSSLFLAITPVFVAVGRNNTIDNILVMFLLLACWALLKATEKGKLGWLIFSMAMIGIGFNVKQLQAYMIIPAIYVTYLFATNIKLKKRLAYLAVSTVVLVGVSLSWALVVDAVPASQRPYVDSSTNNSVMELIFGHNGAERLSGTTNSTIGGGNMQNGGMQTPPNWNNNDMQSPPDMNGENAQPPSDNNNQSPPDMNGANQQQSDNGNSQPSPISNSQENTNKTDNSQFKGNRDSVNDSTQRNDGNFKDRQDGNFQGNDGKMNFNGGNAGLATNFGSEVKAGITRLFTKNTLADQIVWFLPLAIIGFIAAAIRHKLKFKLDNPQKQSIALWFLWLLPVFIYFSFTTGLFHSYYLTMLAPPIAALSGIGLKAMWDMYKEDGWKKFMLPIALFINAIMQLVMLNYYSGTPIMSLLTVMLIILSFGGSIALVIAALIKNKNEIISKALAVIAVVGICVTPLAGSASVMFVSLNSSFPAAGLELLAQSTEQNSFQNKGDGMFSTSNALTEFLLKNKTDKQKYLLVVSNSNSASEIIINTGESVMSLGGFLGKNNAISLDEFKALVEKGEIRYVMTGDSRGGGQSESSEIMSWVKENGTLVETSEYSSQNTNLDKTNSQTQDMPMQNGGMNNSGQLYDLISLTKN